MSARYDPHRIRVSGVSTPYEDFHEHAHLEQHARATLYWRVWQTCRGIPYLAHLSMLLMEVEAAWIARREMRACHAWLPEDRAAAFRGILSYARAVFID